MEQSTAQPKLKLQQVDKDLLIDLAQLLEVEPYDYLSIAHEAYLLTLEPSFITWSVKPRGSARGYKRLA